MFIGNPKEASPVQRGPVPANYLIVDHAAAVPRKNLSGVPILYHSLDAHRFAIRKVNLGFAIETFHRVGDVDIRAGDTGSSEEGVEEAASGSSVEEWLALLILLSSGVLAQSEDTGRERATAGNGLT
jgi:hypothetical protein